MLVGILVRWSISPSVLVIFKPSPLWGLGGQSLERRIQLLRWRTEADPDIVSAFIAEDAAGGEEDILFVEGVIADLVAVFTRWAFGPDEKAYLIAPVSGAEGIHNFKGDFPPLAVLGVEAVVPLLTEAEGQGGRLLDRGERARIHITLKADNAR